jgi:hypothetical protein
LHHGASISGPVKDEIRSRVEVVWSHSDVAFRVVNNENRLLTINDYVCELKLDPVYQDQFPKKRTPRISVKDQEGIAANITKIAKGELEVTDDE